MYSVVLMAAMVSGSETPAWGPCVVVHGCRGSCSGYYAYSGCCGTPVNPTFCPPPNYGCWGCYGGQYLPHPMQEAAKSDATGIMEQIKALRTDLQNMHKELKAEIDKKQDRTKQEGDVAPMPRPVSGLTLTDVEGKKRMADLAAKNATEALAANEMKEFKELFKKYYPDQ
jgi:hypothetical protein